MKRLTRAMPKVASRSKDVGETPDGTKTKKKIRDEDVSSNPLPGDTNESTPYSDITTRGTARSVREKTRDEITSSLNSPSWEMRSTRQDKTRGISLTRNAGMPFKSDNETELDHSQCFEKLAPFVGKHIFE